MSEEHGYQRSGKKCREKFENLYKYYKKTKEGKAGRQDGKHYRFFRQLEALYGESSNQISVPDQTQYMSNNLRFVSNTGSNPISTTHQDHHIHQLGYNNQSHNSLSLSNSSEFESSSSDDNDSSEKRRNRRGGSRGWKAKIKDFIDSQMRKLMEKQEAWLEKLMKTLEQKEKERSLREEEWRKQEVARIEKEHKFWAKERAWIEARDSALMEALKNLTGKEIDHYKSNLACSSLPDQILNNNNNQDIDQDHGSEVQNNVSRAKLGDHHDDQNSWPESEITRMIQLRTSMESRFSQGGFPEEVLWEDIAAKMACLGYDRSGSMCKEKWESINDYVKKSKEVSTSSSGKKRKENSTVGCGGYSNFLNNDNINNNDNNNNNENSSSLYNHGGYNCDQMNDHGNATTTSSPASNANVGSGTGGGGVHHESCFPAFLIGEGTENLWENYGLKINKGGQNQ